MSYQDRRARTEGVGPGPRAAWQLIQWINRGDDGRSPGGVDWGGAFQICRARTEGVGTGPRAAWQLIRWIN